MAKIAQGKIFWSGGSQAVRLPKEMRLRGTEVVIRRRNDTLLIEPVPEGDNWDGFWSRLLSVKHRVKRWKTALAEKRKAL